jgi:hypothetical protein
MCYWVSKLTKLNEDSNETESVKKFTYDKRIVKRGINVCYSKNQFTFLQSLWTKRLVIQRIIWLLFTFALRISKAFTMPKPIIPWNNKVIKPNDKWRRDDGDSKPQNSFDARVWAWFTKWSWLNERHQHNLGIMEERNPDLIALDHLSKPTLIAMVMHYRKKESQNKEILGLTPRQLTGHSAEPASSHGPVLCERCKTEVPHRHSDSTKTLPRESSSSPSKKVCLLESLHIPHA